MIALFAPVLVPVFLVLGVLMAIIMYMFYK